MLGKSSSKVLGYEQRGVNTSIFKFSMFNFTIKAGSYDQVFIVSVQYLFNISTRLIESIKVLGL